MIGRSVVIMAATAALLTLGSHKSHSAGPQCPQFITPITPSGVGIVPGPPPPGLVAVLFNFMYTKWSERIDKPDLAVTSNTDAWKGVPEFVDLIRPRKLFLPFILERLKAGDFRLVPA